MSCVDGRESNDDGTFPFFTISFLSLLFFVFFLLAWRHREGGLCRGSTHIEGEINTEQTNKCSVCGWGVTMGDGPG